MTEILKSPRLLAEDRSFGAAIDADPVLKEIQVVSDQLDYRIGILSEHRGGVTRDILHQRRRLNADIAERVGLLKSCWEAVRGDVVAFPLQVHVIDLQREAQAHAEDGQDNTEILHEFTLAKDALHAYLFSPEFGPPTDGVG